MIAILMFLSQTFAAPCTGDRMRLIATKDGAAICMERHQGDGPPVLLVHGIAANRHFWNLDPNHSLPIHLQQQGFDVWNIDLRGRGGATKSTTGQALNRQWTIDDYGRFDIDAAITEIQQSRPDQPIGFVGHSLGGMALASYLNDNRDETLSSVVVIASPMDFQHQDALLKFAEVATRWSPLEIPIPFLSKLLSLIPVMPISIDRLIWNTKEMTPAIRKKLLHTIVAPMTRNELKQLGKSIRSGNYLAADQNKKHIEGLAKTRMPSLFIAGRGDQIVPVDRCLAYFEAMGSPKKKFVIAGEAWGFSYDYGHSDYTMSRMAATEIYPLISDWMTTHLHSK